MHQQKPSVTAAVVAKGYYKASELHPEQADMQAVEMYKLFVKAFRENPENMQPPSMLTELLQADLPAEAYIDKVDQLLPGLAQHYIARKNAIENEVFEALSKHQAEQVVVIGGGFDTLSLRGSRKFPTIKWIEHDHPATQKLKLQVINNHPDIFGAIPGNLHFIHHDLEHKDDLVNALKSKSYDEKKRTVFILEGVIMYLEPGVASQLLESLHQHSALGSKLIASIKGVYSAESESASSAAQEAKAVSQSGEGYKFAMAEPEFIEFARSKGYAMKALGPYHALAKPFGYSPDKINALAKHRGAYHIVLENVGTETFLEGKAAPGYMGPVPKELQIVKGLRSQRSDKPSER